MADNNLSIFVAFVAGVLSFLSPCVLPLVPAYLGHLLGVTTYARRDVLDGAVTISRHGAARRNRTNPTRLAALSHAVLFVLGFALVFVTFWASVGLLGQFLPGYLRYVRPLGGIILIVLGLNMAGLFRISWLYRSFRITSKAHVTPATGSRPGLPTSFFTGVIFAAGWTPCIGPVLGSIIGLASERSTALEGIYLLIAYSLGLGVPFILCALALGQADSLLKWLNRGLNRTRLVAVVSGLFVALVGVLMLTNVFQTLPQYFNWLAL